jgi:anthranilate phosphoribosyltransferase
MKYAIKPRREIKIRTVFNILGPLTNPANAKAQLLGVYGEHLTEPLANVLNNLGIERAMVVHGIGGLDEISTIGQTKITKLEDGETFTSYQSPEDLGVKTVDITAIEGYNPEESASIAFKILNGQGLNNDDKDNPKRDIVLVNSAAAIQLGGKAKTFVEGLEFARESIQSGTAYDKLRGLIKFSGGDMSKLEELEIHG